ncbi:OV-16 antigen [Smittium mucronatum]|uniref:OV-16 antigen n=1 Tax=Smittium mucronatum TaxID=133383 RepID=A0A1R0GTG4_9FUNG|nr:OV-16 antigen [Smittium mucronatum]
MKFAATSTLFAALLSSTAFAQNPSLASIATKLAADDVIPDVLPAGFVPEVVLNLSYVGRPMEYGTEYFPYINETDSLPVVNYAFNSEDYYTLALVDPDAPSRANPIRAQVRHYLSVNIKGGDITTGNSTSTSYLAPRPFPGCGRKRFVWVLAKQSGYDASLTVPVARPGFNIANYASTNGMTIIAANYFEVEASPAAECIIPGGAASSSAASSAAPTASSAAPTATWSSAPYASASSTAAPSAHPTSTSTRKPKCKPATILV